MRGPLPKPLKKIIIGQPPVDVYDYITPRSMSISAYGSIIALEKKVLEEWGSIYYKDPNAFVALEDMRQEGSKFTANAVYYVWKGRYGQK